MQMTEDEWASWTRLLKEHPDAKWVLTHRAWGDQESVLLQDEHHRGFVLLRPEGRPGIHYIYFAFTLPAHRQQRVATALTQRAVQEFNAYALEVVHLDVARFWEKQGFLHSRRYSCEWGKCEGWYTYKGWFDDWLTVEECPHTSSTTAAEARLQLKTLLLEGEPEAKEATSKWERRCLHMEQPVPLATPFSLKVPVVTAFKVVAHNYHRSYSASVVYRFRARQNETMLGTDLPSYEVCVDLFWALLEAGFCTHCLSTYHPGAPTRAIATSLGKKIRCSACTSGTYHLSTMNAPRGYPRSVCLGTLSAGCVDLKVAVHKSQG